MAVSMVQCALRPSMISRPPMPLSKRSVLQPREGRREESWSHNCEYTPQHLRLLAVSLTLSHVCSDPETGEFAMRSTRGGGGSAAAAAAPGAYNKASSFFDTLSSGPAQQRGAEGR